MGIVIALDVYRPGEWHDFFIIVGGRAAVVTGLPHAPETVSALAEERRAGHYALQFWDAAL